MARQWIANLVKTFEIGEEQTRVGVVVFSDEPTLALALNTFYDKSNLLTAIEEGIRHAKFTSTPVVHYKFLSK